MKLTKKKVARILALLHLLGLITISCGEGLGVGPDFNRPMGFIILSAIFFISGGLLWAIKGGLFE